MFLRALHPGGRGAVREGAEHEFRPSQWCVICSNEADFAPGDKRTFPALGVRGREGQGEVRMVGQKATKLATSVPAGPEYADGDLMHA
jgi:hypothetical protein